MTSDLVQAADRHVSRQRFTSLDGLRGIAAVVVLIHHSFLTVPSLAVAYYPSQGDIARGSLSWFLAYTPMHLVWAGGEAVCLFFVLSGIVLVLPVIRNRRFSWLAYYPKRVVRLYGPVIAAVLLGLLLILLAPRYNSQGLSAWVNRRPNDYTLDALWHDVTLVTGASGVVSPLWSLRWEVLFSLALPVYVIFARARVPGWLKLVTAFALIFWSAQGRAQYFYYLPMFAIGAVIVAHWDELARLARRADERRYAWPLVIGVAVLLTCTQWELIGLGMVEKTAHRFTWLSVLGVTLLVLVAAFCPLARKLLQHRTIQWLGALSFSLYLVHEPIVIATRYLTVDHSPWLGIAISMPLALLAAVLFARWVEKPMQQLSRRAGDRVAKLRPVA